jgi:hypothetical protein
MHILRVKYDDMILVHQRELLFRFQVAEAEPGKVHLDFYLPLFGKDGKRICLEKFERDTLEIGEPLAFEQEGSEGLGIEEGTVEITVASIEGDDVTIYVKTPDGWGAVPEDELLEGEE